MTHIIVPEEIITGKIYLIRNQKVMLDSDLAQLYGVETKRLKEQVKRNITRFPMDFMFQLSDSEWLGLRSQIATSNLRGGIRYNPMAFTEQGVAMLSSVLNSEKAIEVNIQIIRIFTKLRAMLMDTTVLQLEIEKIKKKLDNHDKNIELVFTYLDQLIDKQESPTPRKEIGFNKSK
jgi:phage regulator Rha-like protein